MDFEVYLTGTEDEIKGIRNICPKSENEIEESVLDIRRWLSEQPHLPYVEDNLLVNILKYNKFDLKRTKNKIDMFYSIRNIKPEFFANRDPLSEEMQELMNTAMVFPMPTMTEDYGRVLIAKLTTNNPYTFDPRSFFKFLLLVNELRLVADNSLFDIVIFDFAGVSFRHVIKTSPFLVRDAYSVLQKAYSDRIKALHILNAPMYANALIYLVRSILKQKIAGRVNIHKTMESLQYFIPPENLPSDYIGTQPSVKEIWNKWRIYVEDKSDWIRDESKKKSNEELRPNTDDTAL